MWKGLAQRSGEHYGEWMAFKLFQESSKEIYMRKKIVKKLVLSRETLVGLDRNDLGQAAGGATRLCSELGSCGLNTCASCSPTCTSRLC